MHTLMASVLLRVAGPDAFDADAEPEPPDRELREVVEPVGAGEGQAVVGADRVRQTPLPEEMLKGLEAPSSRVDGRASQARIMREALSVTVRG